MPSIVTHAVVGLAAAGARSKKGRKTSIFFVSAVLAALPDADSLGFALGVPYGHFLGHRGFFHSIVFGLILGFAAVLPVLRRKAFTGAGLRLWAFFAFLASSHGLLDLFTNGGLGIAVLSPFDTARYFSPWRPILVSPISPLAFFGPWGLRVLFNEMLWVWLPAAALAAGWRLAAAGRKKTRPPLQDPS